MSDSNRGVLAAFAGIAALLVATGAGAFYGSLYSPAKKQYAAVNAGDGSEKSYNGVTESLPDIAFIPDPVERAIANPEPQSGQDHEKRDLAAQESMAVWAFYMALFAGATALITGVGTYFIAAQVKLTREAVEATSKATDAMLRQNTISEAANKPYIYVRLCNDTFKAEWERQWENKIQTKYDGFHTTFIIENIGNLPAYDIEFEVAMFWDDQFSGDASSAGINGICIASKDRLVHTIEARPSATPQNEHQVFKVIGSITYANPLAEPLAEREAMTFAWVAESHHAGTERIFRPLR